MIRTTLRIVADGRSDAARNEARGRLFEQLCEEVLRGMGYHFTSPTTNVTYAGMEIDIEGVHEATQTPLVAECKCMSDPVDARKLQAYAGKFFARWKRNNRTHGFFMAVPGITTPARGYYNDTFRDDNDVVMILLEQPRVLSELYKRADVLRPDQVAHSISPDEGKPGDSMLIYSPLGLFWIQWVVPQGSGIATSVCLLTSNGQRLTDAATIDQLSHMLQADLTGLDVLNEVSKAQVGVTGDDIDQVVEVQGGGACFEYQYPASPQFFVGRDPVLASIDSFVEEVAGKQTSDRGLLFQGHSGWGKSSAVLATVDRLRRGGHAALAIDARSASSPQFFLRAVDYAISALRANATLFDSFPRDITVTGFSGAIASLKSIGQSLERHGKVLVLIFDQFENVFFHVDVLQPLRNAALAMSQAGTNVVLGFSWKSDLVGFTTDFPYRLRDDIISVARTMSLDRFSEHETGLLLDRLSQEIRSKLRADLRFFLSDFSRGYPWLLKRLCAHVKSQREKGVVQADIALRLLNVEELFGEDLNGLDSRQESALREIARKAPITIASISEDFEPSIVQSLVDRRLVVRIGSKYDIYWDIFRDYLNTGRVPVEENYLLKMQVQPIERVALEAARDSGTIDIDVLCVRENISKQTFLNIARDMRVLGIASTDGGYLRLTIDGARHGDDEAFHVALKRHATERLPRNRLVRLVLRELEESGDLTIQGVADTLSRACPYVSASPKTWKSYARSLCDWLDFADLVIYHKESVRAFDPNREVRTPRRVGSRPRAGMYIPQVPYEPVVDGAERIVLALRKKQPIDWSGVKPSTRTKVLAALSALGFIERTSDSVSVNSVATVFVDSEAERQTMFRDAALKLSSIRVVKEIFDENPERRWQQRELGHEVARRCQVQWTDATAAVQGKMLVAWARAAGIAPRQMLGRRHKQCER